MPYISSDGQVGKRPFSLYGIFWAIVNFFYLFYMTLINADYNKHGEKYTREYRSPGSGPPRPPSRRFGGFNSGSGPAPPPAGGCGCG
ncbi:selenoprotein K-like [Leguminivora glycinivorella]|uniref:selenoprotein K-like n=1 Tax=Leguminivora glycinivorella TaxID=1035111 RepID=UPI00200F56CF|nr:selenoprotein K-like [Leguminivora glycinivorella]